VVFFALKGKRFLMAKLLQYHCRFILFACAVKYKGMNTKGVFSGQPALILSNHINYLDVLILAAINPLGFLAKKEVGHWGILGRFNCYNERNFCQSREYGITG
jgi:1-acyl-sn-glycerol-3-phosphate acyltransferase